MKKLILSLGFLTSMAGAASAQQARFGVKGGLGLAKVVGADVKDQGFENRFAYSAGLMADIGFGEHFAFHPELLYSQKGTKQDYTDVAVYATSGSGSSSSTITQKSNVRLSYLELPLLLRGKAAGFFLEAGPQVGYLLSAHSVVNSTEVITMPGNATVTYTNNEDSNSTDNLRRFEVGYALGLGYQLPQGFEVGVRYNGSFTSLDNSNNADRLRVRNSMFQLQLGYSFGK